MLENDTDNQLRYNERNCILFRAGEKKVLLSIYQTCLEYFQIFFEAGLTI